MTVAHTEVYLYHVARGEPEAAELWHAITERQLADWEGEWMPELFKAMHRLRRAGVDMATKPALELAKKGGYAPGDVG